MDVWIRACEQKTYDDGGRWAARGAVNRSLLDDCLAEPFFHARPPKSTGRELFNRAWLDGRLARCGGVSAVDVQATLAELTAVTIAAAIRDELPDCRQVIVCGGGVHNDVLMTRLGQLTAARVTTTESHGVPPDWVEGAAFAWLARARVRGLAGNVPTVTGARRAAILGGVYWGATP
jgi:anhydro-N-acetylmuramic acid kinase